MSFNSGYRHAAGGRFQLLRLTARRRRVRQRGGHRGRRLHGTRLCRILGLMSPEITLANQVRWRVAIADRRMKEAVELVRTAAATPGYSGPTIADLERVAAGIGEIRDQVKAWSFDAQVRRAARPRIASRGQQRAVLKAIAITQR